MDDSIIIVDVIDDVRERRRQTAKVIVIKDSEDESDDITITKALTMTKATHHRKTKSQTLHKENKQNQAQKSQATRSTRKTNETVTANLERNATGISRTSAAASTSNKTGYNSSYSTPMEVDIPFLEGNTYVDTPIDGNIRVPELPMDLDFTDTSSTCTATTCSTNTSTTTGRGQQRRAYICPEPSCRKAFPEESHLSQHFVDKHVIDGEQSKEKKKIRKRRQKSKRHAAELPPRTSNQPPCSKNRPVEPAVNQPLAKRARTEAIVNPGPSIRIQPHRTVVNTDRPAIRRPAGDDFVSNNPAKRLRTVDCTSQRSDRWMPTSTSKSAKSTATVTSTTFSVGYSKTSACDDPAAKKKRKRCLNPSTRDEVTSLLAGLERGDPPSCDRLRVMKHIILIDLDNWRTILTSDLPFAMGTFVWGFHGGQVMWVPPHNSVLLGHLLQEGCFYLHPRCGTSKDAADFALCVQAGRLDMVLPKNIPFTVLSGDTGFREVKNQLSLSQREVHIVDPHHKSVDTVLALLNSITEK